MKIKLYILAIASILAFGSCETDNYDAPGTMLEGHLMYQGKEVATKKAEMRIEVYEKGWDFEKEIEMKVDQNGHYSETLFDGSYKLFLKNGRGSFSNFTSSDTIHFELNGNQQLDIEVEPFFFVNEPNYSVSGSTLTATVKVDKVVTEKQIGKVKLLVGKTMLVDDQYKEIDVTLEEIADLSNITLTADISDLVSKGYCFARVAVGTEGVSTYNYSFVKKLDL
ncbi:DUF3823 domain-containing protein [Puteibacter caeruleilacunae]|nr:DUF3823 domain-containing protein [Puteibacter caeruleilacunae]